MTKNSKSVLIIGAGLGGLATALRMSVKGYSVTIVEKDHQAGGRLNEIKQDGFTFDMGPSFFSMSYEFDELFKSCGYIPQYICEDVKDDCDYTIEYTPEEVAFIDNL